MCNLTKIAISQATSGVGRPTSTTFVDIFKGYIAVVYTKIKFQEEAGQNNTTAQHTELVSTRNSVMSTRYGHTDPV